MLKLIFLLSLIVFAASGVLVAVKSKTRGGRIAVAIIGLIVLATPIILPFVVVAKPRQTVARFDPETTLRMNNPQKVVSTDPSKPAGAAESNLAAPSVLDNRTGLSGYQKLEYALNIPGAGLPGYIEANKFYSMYGYTSYAEFKRSVGVLAEVERQNPEANFISVVAYGRSADEKVSAQEVVDSALGAGLQLEDSLGSVSNINGTLLVGSGSPVGGDANGAGTVVPYLTEVGRSTNFVINLFSPQDVAKIAKHYGVDTKGFESASNPVAKVVAENLLEQQVYAADTTGGQAILQTFKLKKIGPGKVQIIQLENGQEIGRGAVTVSEKDADGFSEEKTFDVWVNPEGNLSAHTIYELCVNPNLGMAEPEEVRTPPTTGNPPVVVPPTKTPPTKTPTTTEEPPGTTTPSTTEPPETTEPPTSTEPPTETTEPPGTSTPPETTEPPTTETTEEPPPTTETLDSKHEESHDSTGASVDGTQDTSESSETIASDSIVESEDGNGNTSLAPEASSTNHEEDVVQVTDSTIDLESGYGENPYQEVSQESAQQVISEDQLPEPSVAEESAQAEVPATEEVQLEDTVSNITPVPSIGADATYVDTLPQEEYNDNPPQADYVAPVENTPQEQPAQEGHVEVPPTPNDTPVVPEVIQEQPAVTPQPTPEPTPAPEVIVEIPEETLEETVTSTVAGVALGIAGAANFAVGLVGAIRFKQ